jgi:hypothetical protein
VAKGTDSRKSRCSYQVLFLLYQTHSRRARSDRAGAAQSRLYAWVVRGAAYPTLGGVTDRLVWLRQRAGL